jgi:hypothetical protein
MQKQSGRQSVQTVLFALVLASASSSAHADPMTIPGYTVTDLGAGTPTFATDANGNGVLNSPSGRTYAFSTTTDTILTPGQGIGASIPLLNPPTFAPDPSAPWIHLASAVMNSNGIVAAVNAYGVGDLSYNESAYYVQRDANGSWGQPVTIFQGPGEPGSFPTRELGIVGMSNMNSILINNYNIPGVTQPNALLYNINTQSITNLGSLLSTLNPFYTEPQGLAIDGEGRILLVADSELGVGPPRTNLLITPAGLSSEPIEVPAPEPGTLAIMLMALASFAVRRVRERRRAG